MKIFRKCAVFLAAAMAAAAVLPINSFAATSFDKSSPTAAVISEKPADLFKEPYCFYSGNGVEIWGEKSVSVSLPMEDNIARDILFVNTTDTYMEVSQSGAPDISGKLAAYTEEQLAIFHPNPLTVRMEPRETVRGVLTVSFGNKLHNLKQTVSGDLTIKQDFSIRRASPDPERLGSASITVKTQAKAYPVSYLTDAKNCKATISGYITDASGNAVKDAEVEISGGYVDRISARTDAKGYYSAKVYAYKSVYYGTWHQFKVTASKAGYGTLSALTRPENGKSVTCSLKLPKESKKLSYKKSKTADIGVQGYYSDESDDGKLIAIVPFHSGLPQNDIKKDSNLVLTDKTGSSVKKIPLGGETPYADVSADGKYIAVSRASDDGSYSIVTIYDKSGKIVYERSTFPETKNVWTKQESFICRCEAFSPDAKQLIVGSLDGDVFCIDWKSDKVVWTANVRNQVRTIDYSKDGSLLYISSGDGYLYCFTKAGKLKWKTYTGSWGTSVAVGKKYVIVSTKCATNSLRVLNAKTGKQIWCYDTPARGEIVLSPDESVFWFGDGTSSASSVVSGTVFSASSGKVKYSTNVNGAIAAWSGDGKYLVVKGMQNITVYKGSNGEILWSEQMNDLQNGCHVLSVSSDGKSIMAGFSEKHGRGTLYFYKTK